MAEYRIYLIDETGRIRQAEEVEAASDAAALARAHELTGGQRYEVWSGTRQVDGDEAERRQA